MSKRFQKMVGNRRSRTRKTFQRKTDKSIGQFSQIMSRGEISFSPIQSFDFSKKSLPDKDKIFKKMIQQVNENQKNQSKIQVESQEQQNSKFCNADLANKFVMLLLMTLVMIFLGVVTPNTVLANRQPEQRYIYSQPSKLSKQIKSQSTKNQQKTIILTKIKKKDINSNPNFYMSVITPEQLIPEAPKMPLLSQQNNFIERVYQRRNIFWQRQQVNSQNLYSLSQDIKNILENSINLVLPAKQLRNMGHNQLFKSKDISLNQFIQQKQMKSILPIKLLQITHNIDYQGRIFLDETQYHDLLYYKENMDSQSTQQKNILSKVLQKISYLKTILKQQSQYYQKKYKTPPSLSLTQNKTNFCILSYSSQSQLANSFFYRKLDSIFQQQYQNYHTIYVSRSKDQSIKIMKYMKDNKIPTSKFNIVQIQMIQKVQLKEQSHKYQDRLKSRKYFEMIFLAGTVGNNFCSKGQVVIVLGQHRALVGRKVLSVYDSVYKQGYNSTIVYSKQISIQNNKKIIIKVQSQEIYQSESLDNKLNQEKLKDIFVNKLFSFSIDLIHQIYLSFQVDSSFPSDAIQNVQQEFFNRLFKKLSGQKLFYLDQYVSEKRPNNQ